MNADVASREFERIRRELLLIRLSCAALAGICIGQGLLLYWNAHHSHRRLIVQELILKNGRGETVARLGGTAGSTCLEITGQKKESSAELCAGDGDGAALNLSTRSGEAKASLSAGGTASESIAQSIPPYLALAHEGKSAITLNVGTVPNPLFGTLSGMNAVEISSPDHGDSTVSIQDNKGKRVWSTAVPH